MQLGSKSVLIIIAFSTLVGCRMSTSFSKLPSTRPSGAPQPNPTCNPISAVCGSPTPTPTSTSSPSPTSSPSASPSPSPIPTSTPSPTPSPSSTTGPVFPSGTPLSTTPIILYTDIISGPNSGGENNHGAYLSLFGKNFGNDLTKAKVYVGGGEVSRYIYLGRSFGRHDIQQLSVQLGPNVSSGTIKVVVNGQDSNIDHQFTVRPGKFFFVSLNGNDSTGAPNDINRPYRTANHIVRNLTTTFLPGDFIVMRGGTYVLGDGTHNIVASSYIRANRGGALGAPMTFIGYPGEPVIFHQNSDAKIWSNYSAEVIAHWVMGDFKVTADEGTCSGWWDVISVGNTAPSTPICSDTGDGTGLHKANYVKVVNIEIDGQDRGGLCFGHDTPVAVGYSDHAQVLGVSIHNTSSKLLGTESSHEIYLNVRQTNTEVGWNEVYNIPTTRAIIQVAQDNYGCYGTKAITGISIHDNVIHDTVGQAILLSGASGDVDVFNNLIYNMGSADDNRYDDLIALRGQGGTLNARLYNNTIYANANHTLVGELLYFGDVGSGDCPQSVILENNIFYATEAQDAYSVIRPQCAGKLVINSANNVWFGSNGGLPVFASPTDTQQDPRFVNAPAGNFHLQTGSPAFRATSPAGLMSLWNFEGFPRSSSFGYNAGAF